MGQAHDPTAIRGVAPIEAFHRQSLDLADLHDEAMGNRKTQCFGDQGAEIFVFYALGEVYRVGVAFDLANGQLDNVGGWGRCMR